MTNRVLAAQSPHLGARVVRRWPLVYGTEADRLEDRPPHVRAGSGMIMLGGRLAIIQDDAYFIALVDTAERTVQSVPLPAGHDGMRQFDDVRGNKRWKADLEACTAVIESGREALLMMGSGSNAEREQILIASWPLHDAQDIQRFDAPEFYATLRLHGDFAGAELNIEGAVLLGEDCLRLFQRGNGAVCQGQVPCNATCDVSWQRLSRHLRDPRSVAPPAPQNIVQYDLGSLDGVRLTFTDGAARKGALFFTAAAEASPDAIADGPVAGSVLGRLGSEGAACWSVLENEDGTPYPGKAEGLVLDPSVLQRAWVVVDLDDPSVPSELCEIQLAGDWDGR
jgi:hypothetical protein